MASCIISWKFQNMFLVIEFFIVIKFVKLCFRNFTLKLLKFDCRKAVTFHI